MYGNLNTEDLLLKWIEAAKIFCKARKPNYGRFTEITQRVHWEYADRNRHESNFFSTLVEAKQSMAQHILKARPGSNCVALDRALLGNVDFAYEVDTCVRSLTTWCKREGVLNEKQAAALVAAAIPHLPIA